MIDKLVHQTFEFDEEGKTEWKRLSNHPACKKKLVTINFENEKFEPIKKDCKNESELEEAKDYANKMNQIVTTYGMKIITKEGIV